MPLCAFSWCGRIPRCDYAFGRRCKILVACWWFVGLVGFAFVEVASAGVVVGLLEVLGLEPAGWSLEVLVSLGHFCLVPVFCIVQAGR